MGQEPDNKRLRDAARRLADELDAARLYRAAAYASMAGDAVQAMAAAPPTNAEGGLRIPALPQGRQVRDVLRQAQDDPSTGSGRTGRSGGSTVPDAADIDLDFTLDEQDRVWMIREGDCHMLGRTDPVCAEMRRFLADVALGGDGYGPAG